MSGNKVLILGAKGMLGQALLKEFSASYEVVAWDREDVDITEKDILRDKISAMRPDIIINTVAHNGVDKIETDNAEFSAAQKINGEAVKNLAAIANDLDAIIIHYSTDYVFDGKKETGYTEADAPNPISRYGQTKFQGEKNLLETSRKFYLIRLSKLFSNVSAGPTSKKSFVETMLGLYQTGKKELELVDEELSSPTYAPDLAKFTRGLLENRKPWWIYHGANFGAGTWYELGKTIFEIKKFDVCIVPVSSSKYPRPALRPQTSILLNTKMPQQRSWQAALKEALQILWF